MLRWLLVLGLAVGSVQAQVKWQPVPKVNVGTIERIDAFPSRHVETRAIDVWLPPGYSPQKRYQVLYVQDGQMLFDATHTWNKKAWNLHLALNALVQSSAVPDTIVVAIPNAEKLRYSEFFPKKQLAGLPPAVRAEYLDKTLLGKARSDDYLRFLVQELKPAIDKRFATRPERQSTFLLGSSMGGMVSLYALCEYPKVFGGVAALSTHWVGMQSIKDKPPQAIQNTEFAQATLAYLRTHLPSPATHRIYMDHGTNGLDALYGDHQNAVDDLVRGAGYTPVNFLSVLYLGAGHTEPDWAARQESVLKFLLAR